MKKTVSVSKQERRNLIAFPIATVGRDMCSQFFSLSVLNFILFTKNLTVEQFSAVSAIIVAARVFDAFNDPIMGTIIDRTHTKIGKFKPWMITGVITTSMVVFAAFVNNLTGWRFVGFFGFIYFMFSICFTMNDISYWGMIPALSSNPESRNRFTSRTMFFSGMGAAFVTVLVPMLTAGDHVIGGNAVTAYRTLAVVACLAPVTMLSAFIFVRENREDSGKKKENVSLGKIFKTIFRNDQLKWVALVFVCQQVGSALISNGLGSTYIYLEFGYNGTLATLFTVIGMSTTVFLMLFYPAIAKKHSRNSLIKVSAAAVTAGYLFVLAAGLFAPHASMLKYGLIVSGFAVANFGSYCIYLIMNISISNTVEYNEYKFGIREEGIISSVRPFLTKLGNAVALMLISLFYLLTGVTTYTNRISELENQASQGLVTADEKLRLITEALSGVTRGETTGLLLAMTLIPLATALFACFLYLKKYKITEEKYLEILGELEENKAEVTAD